MRRVLPYLPLLLCAPLALAACGDDKESGGDGGDGGTATDSGSADGGTTGGDSGASTDGGDGSGDGADTGPDPIDYGPVRGDLTIRQIEISQSVVQPLYVNGVSLTLGQRNIPIVKNRPTIVRALWGDLPAGWAARPIEARLHVVHSDATEDVYPNYTQEGPTVISDPSSDNRLSDSFFWRLEPDQHGPGDSVYVTLHEVSDQSGIPDSAVVSWPEQGPVEMGVQANDSWIKIALLGVEYNNGSCQTDTGSLSEGELQAIKEGFEAWMGVESDKVFIQERGTVYQADASTQSIQQLLGIAGQRRSLDNPDPDAFYYILWNSCGSIPGGVLGIAPLGNENPSLAGASSRYAAGIWNSNDITESVATAVHEVGHNQGAEHAPCGIPGGTDPQFPHAQASIGVRGLDPKNGQMYLPQNQADYMSYCRPYWVSDYRWTKTYLHMSELTALANGGAPIPAPEPGGHTLSVEAVHG